MIHDDTRCILGEGPLWHPQREELFWFDIKASRLHRKGQLWQFDRMVSAAGWISETELLIADTEGLFRFDLNSLAIDRVAEIEKDNPVTRSNDGRADPWGGFWIGTMGRNAEEGAGAIYRYYKGETRQLYPGITIPNATCFAPDGSFALFTDGPTGRIMKQALAEADGWPEGEPVVWLDLSGEDFSPDGAVIDADGNFWNAQWGAGRVACYGPDGVLKETVALPAVQTSCPAFGGDGLSTLFCTSSGEGQSGEHDGKTFAVTVAASGQQEHRVLL